MAHRATTVGRPARAAAVAICALVASLVLATAAAAPASCADVFTMGYTASGIYSISPGTGVDGQEKRLHCAFDSARGIAWTLMRSFSLSEGSAGGAMHETTLYADTPVNDGDAGVSRATLYSLGNADMTAVGGISSLFMMGCNFDISQTRDYVLVNTSDWNPLTDTFAGACRPVLAIELRGEGGCTDCTVAFWHRTGATPYPLHIDSFSQGGCAAAASIGPGSVSSEDNFGYYNYPNPKHACSANSGSTTQHWFGSVVAPGAATGFHATPISRRNDFPASTDDAIAIAGVNDGIAFGDDSSSPVRVWRTVVGGAAGEEDAAALAVSGKLVVDGVDVVQELNRTRDALIEVQKRLS